MTADLQKFTDGIDAALRTSNPTAALRALFVDATTEPTPAPAPADPPPDPAPDAQ